MARSSASPSERKRMPMRSSAPSRVTSTTSFAFSARPGKSRLMRGWAWAAAGAESAAVMRMRIRIAELRMVFLSVGTDLPDLLLGGVHLGPGDVHGEQHLLPRTLAFRLAVRLAHAPRAEERGEGDGGGEC